MSQNELSRCFAGRRAVYLAVDEKRQKQQQRERERQQIKATEAAATEQAEQASFPPNYDVVTVLEVLIQIIKTPKSDSAQLAKALRARGVKMTAGQVQRVIEFYALQKKRNTRRRESSTPTNA